jgi:hypothetical protein
MGKIIKINENIFRNLIKDSMLKEASFSGNVAMDGNSMTGGSYKMKPVTGIYFVDIQELVELLSDDTYSDSLYRKLKNIEKQLYFEIQAYKGNDSSVGLPEGYYDISVDTRPCIQAISNLSLFRGDEIYELKQAIETIADRIKNSEGEDVNWR